MAITESDIKLLKSARMTDTSDGGGQMTGNVVQSGVDNNIFDDVSALDRVYGQVSLRKVFPAVLTNTTDKFLGARVIIDKPPADSYVHGALMGATSVFDTRDQARVKVEGYLSRGTASEYYLYGDHIEGQSVVMVASTEATLQPDVGTVLVLRRKVNSTTYNEQYVKTTSVSSTVVTFNAGDPQNEFKLRLSTCNISDPLRDDYLGWGALRDGRITQDLLDVPANEFKSVVYNSIVADAAEYYGIRPLETTASIGDFSIKADSAYSPLLPSAQIETPIADSRINGLVDALVVSGAPVTITSLTPTPTQNTFIGGAVTPGTLSVTAGSVVVTDAGGVLKLGGTPVGAIDYANGILSMSVDSFGGRVSCTITYTPANVPQTITASDGQVVTINNRSLSFTRTLPSKPARASLSFSYMAEGRWYVLRDDGSGALRGSESGVGAGTVNFTTNTVIITMGALPDVGSALILQWVEEARITVSTEIPLRAGGKVFAPLNTSGTVALQTGAKALVPGAVTVTWNDGGTKTAVDNGLGVLSGDATGTVDYQAGLILWSPTTLPAKGTVVNINGDKYSSTTTNVTATGIGTSSLTFSLGGSVQSGTLSFTVGAQFRYNEGGTLTIVSGTGPSGGETSQFFTTDVLLSIRDSGGGNLVATCGQAPGWSTTIGTVNYSTGLVNLSFDVADIPTMGGLLGIFQSGMWRRYAYATTTAGVALRNFSGSPSIAVTYATSGSAPTIISVTVNDVMVAVDYVPRGSSLGPVSFSLGANRYVSTSAGDLQVNPSASTGVGTSVGTVYGSLGLVVLSQWPAGSTTSVTGFSGVFLPPTEGDDANFTGGRVLFRTAVAPLRPASLQILGTMQDGTTFNVTAGSDGKINASRVKGRVNYEFGVIELVFCNPSATSLGTIDVSDFGIAGVTTVNADIAKQETLRYNAVAYTYLPLDADILGLDPVRLPSDGRVPVFKAGRVVVVHNTQSLPAATVSNGQTVNCGRTLLSRIRVFGNDGLEITSGFSKNLDAGTITFTNVAGYSQPVTVEHRIEDEALCAEVQITGQIRLTRPLTHNYTVPGTYVSSAYVKGTLQAAAQDAFSQLAWTNVWSDSIIGDPILAQYNDTANPIVVTNAGAITERWAVIFQTNTTFNLVGESVGQIISGSTGADLAPVNPATGVPYFTLAAAGWGTGWVAGNVVRFNTVGANFPLWVARTVMQSPAAAPGTDQMVISIRGDIDV